LFFAGCGSDKPAISTSATSPPTTTLPPASSILPLDEEKILFGGHDRTVWHAKTMNPDGQHIAFLRFSPSFGPSEIFIIDADGRNLKQLTENPDTELSPHWSPDGRSLVFYNEDVSGTDEILGTIFTINIDGTNYFNTGQQGVPEGWLN